MPPTNRHGLQDPGERQGNKGKAAWDAVTEGGETKGSRGYSTNEKLRPETGSMEDSGMWRLPVAAFPSLSLMLIFLVYHMISMSVLH